MSLRSLRFLAPLVATAGWILAAWGCSAAEDSSPSGTPTGTTTSGTGGGGGNSSTTTGSDGGGGGFNFGGSTGQGGFNNDAACAATSAAAELLPLDIIILLDRSGSMSGSNWNGSTAALDTFIDDPASAGLNVGIAYFPVANLGGLDDCDYTLYDDLAVPIGELPMNAPALHASIAAEDPLGGSTPMYGALKGVLFAATAYQDANPTHKVIVVFASDGDPNSCPGNENQIPVIAGLAASALNYNGVQTYVIAISGASLANLNQIASAGGTNAAYDVTSDVSAFSQKMAEIRASALACEFLIPPPPDGEDLDFNLVSVQFTAGDGTASEIPKASDVGDCGAGPGWYYDNNANPTKIILCPGSCTAVQNDHEAQLNVLFGCVPPNN
ncbi:MAG: VWA domain-containing protein [Polyangiaceae bacterium]|nr:VWA domain-containing protein [Polyangiaceae bacterium]